MRRNGSLSAPGHLPVGNDPRMHDVVIVGPSLAESACVQVLVGAGIACKVVDASRCVGGRVRTDFMGDSISAPSIREPSFARVTPFVDPLRDRRGRQRSGHSSVHLPDSASAIMPARSPGKTRRWKGATASQ